MGMVLNRFGMLKNLQRDLQKEKPYFANFKLTAVIVHDPRDKEFVRFVSRRFDKLSRLTGENFLFITFIQPSESKRRISRQNCSYSFDKDKMLYDGSIVGEAETQCIVQLREYFGIKGSGSYLVLSRNLLSKRTYIIGTNASVLEEQMSAITDYCEDSADSVDMNSDSFDYLLRNLRMSESETSIDFIDCLLDYSAVTSKPYDDWGKSNQREYLDEMVKRMKKDLEDSYAAGMDDDEYDKKLIALYSYFAVGFKTVKSKRRGVGSDYLVSRDKPHRSPRYSDDYELRSSMPSSTTGFLQDRFPMYDEYDYYRYGMDRYEINLDYCDFGLDEISKVYVDSHNNVLDGLLYRGTFDETDLSALVVFLGNIVEFELNRSVFQLIRRDQGIPMPKCYDRYYDIDKKYIVDTSSTPDEHNYVNLNEFDYDYVSYTDLKHLSIGTIAYVYNKLYNTSGLDFVLRPAIKRAEEIFANINSLRRARNRADHPGRFVCREDYERIAYMFNQFLVRSMDVLRDLKHRLEYD